MIQRLKSLSIKARVTLFTLATFIAGLWILFFFIQHNLQKDIQHLASEQQHTTASIVANEINEQLRNSFYQHPQIIQLIEETEKRVLSNEISSFTGAKILIEKHVTLSSR